MLLARNKRTAQSRNHEEERDNDMVDEGTLKRYLADEIDKAVVQIDKDMSGYKDQYMACLNAVAESLIGRLGFMSDKIDRIEKRLEAIQNHPRNIKTSV